MRIKFCINAYLFFSVAVKWLAVRMLLHIHIFSKQKPWSVSISNSANCFSLGKPKLILSSSICLQRNTWRDSLVKVSIIFVELRVISLPFKWAEQHIRVKVAEPQGYVVATMLEKVCISLNWIYTVAKHRLQSVLKLDVWPLNPKRLTSCFPLADI